VTAVAGHIAIRRMMQVMLGAAFVLAAWHMAVRGFGIPKYLVPVPLEVAGAVQLHWRTIASQAGFTLSAAACGLTLSMVLATSLAISFTMSRKFAQTTLPVVLVFRSTPVAAVAPIMMLIFGRGISTSMAVVTIVSFFPMLVNMMRGLQSADRNAAELLYVYGASRWQQLRMVRIPYALPYLFTGLRVAGSSAILGAMLSEWITGTKGLGNLILESGELRETELLWAAVLTSVIVALTVFWSTSAAEKRLLRWTQR
jgi:NitT/TauT family transport system permease protein